jgi:transcriptional regulator with XRE-family HTH domain
MRKPDNPVSPGAQFRALYQEFPLSKNELSRRTGISVSTITLLENDAVQHPRMETIERLTGLLGPEVRDLWRRKPLPTVAQTLVITINIENDAFADDPLGEVSRIITEAAGRFRRKSGLFSTPLMDINGNTVGSMKLVYQVKRP